MLRSHPSPIKLALRNRQGTQALVYFISAPWNSSQISGTQSGAPPALRQSTSPVGSRSGLGPRFCISNKFPGDAKALGRKAAFCMQEVGIANYI